MGRFKDAAQEQRQGNIATEFWLFLRQSKKWWLLPILVTFLLLGAFLLLSSTAAAPFIYTFF